VQLAARAALLVALVLLFSASSGTATADIEGDRFTSPEWRVQMTAPNNWQLTEKTAYPSVLLQLVRRSPDGTMLLTAERLPGKVDARTYANQTTQLLRRMGFRVRVPQLHSTTGAYLVDSERGRAFLRQSFLVAGSVGYSLTLAAPDSRIRAQHLRAFDSALRSIQILRERDLPAPAPDAPGSESGSEPGSSPDPE
jgi:hypothetical protein